MPEVLGHNERYSRGGRRKDKSHVEMTAQEKEGAATCRGEKDKHLCKNPVFVCKECANYGCSQTTVEKCSEQGFKNDKCLNCGTKNNRVLVMEEEYDEIAANWEKQEQ